jgi:PhnB protein
MTLPNLYPYLRFEKAKEAITYYEEVFGATLISHMPLSKEMAEQFGVSTAFLENSTMHAEMRIEGIRVLCSDRFGGENKFEGIGLMIDFNIEDEAELARMHALWERVSASHTLDVHFPLSQQFWGGWMGQFNDAYGVNWMFHGQPFSQMTP